MIRGLLRQRRTVYRFSSHCILGCAWSNSSRFLGTAGQQEGSASSSRSFSSFSFCHEVGAHQLILHRSWHRTLDSFIKDRGSSFTDFLQMLALGCSWCWDWSGSSSQVENPSRSHLRSAGCRLFDCRSLQQEFFESLNATFNRLLGLSSFYY